MDHKHTASARLGQRIAGLCALIAILAGLSAPAVAPTAAQTTDGWQAQYFPKKDFTGAPVSRTDRRIDFNWPIGTGPADDPAFGSPAFPKDNFSVRWTRTVDLEPGEYVLSAAYDDSVRVLIDGTEEISATKPPVYGPAFSQKEVTLPGGSTTFTVEFVEAFADAFIQFNYGRKASGGVVRVDSFGTGYADSLNNYWPRERAGDPAFYSSPSITSTLNVPIWNTVDDALYTTQRAGLYTYTIPVPADGDYFVRLHFAELYFNDPGVRRFDVFIEGELVLNDLDMYGRAQKHAAFTEIFRAGTNGDSAISISFDKVFDNPTLAAVDIYPASSAEDLVNPTIAPFPEPENATYAEDQPPSLTLAMADNAGLRDGYWRLNNNRPHELFADLGATSFGQSFSIPQVEYDALPLGNHTLSFGASDGFGNAVVKTWRFRKLKEAGAVPIAFATKEILNDQTPGAEEFDNPTTIEYGPDDRLYVGQHDLFYFNGWNGGYIHAITLDEQHNVAAIERIDAIFNTPNLDQSGQPQIGGDGNPVRGRHLIGLSFDPESTPERPIMWVVHSDPQFCFNQSGASCNVNIKSGMITRLVGPDFDNPANRTDFVTGLPRSRENHAPNAVHIGPDGWLYLSIGSNTNYGAPSKAFSELPEDYLTAAILRFNVKGAPAQFPLDVSAADSKQEELPGVFELYATGYRNPYDFLWHSNGHLYLNNNHGNFTAGTTPGPEHGCPGGVALDPGTRADFLAVVERGDFGGHPNPARGECVLDNGAMYSPPLTPLPNYKQPLLEYSNGTSTNGIAEYRAATFGGQMLGNIISATFYGNKAVRRVVLSEDGQSVVFEENLAYFKGPLDVTTGPDGAIYVLEYGSENDNEPGATPPKILVMEPEPPIEGFWEVKQPIPTPVQEVAVAACNNKVHVIGGIVGTTAGGVVSTNALWQYDPAADEWTQLADYPGPALNHATAACANGKLYLVGGFLNFAPVNTLYEYDPATDEWTQKANLPQARGAGGAASYDGEIYYAGGIGQEGQYEAKTSLYAYSPALNQWRTLPSMSVPRDHLAMDEVNGRLYVIGGRNVTLETTVDTVEIYDIATGDWSLGASMPIRRAAMSSAVLHNQILVWGGENQPSLDPNTTPAGTYPQGQMYDPRTDRWTPVAGQLTPRHGTDGAVIGNAIYIPAGGPNWGTAVTDVNEVFTFISTDVPQSCLEPGGDPAADDSDGDGYSDKDELDNGTDPCSPASQPLDFDGDNLSDLNDPDDDNDGVPDSADQYQLDSDNGLATELPFLLTFDPGSAVGYLKGTGFPGYQVTSSGAGYLPQRISVGGAGGYLGLNATAGTNKGGANSQDNALQVGFDATRTVMIHTRLADPLNGQQLDPGKSGGIFFGLDEDSYVKLAVETDIGVGLQQTAQSTVEGTTGIVLSFEQDGAYAQVERVALALPGVATLDLALVLDAANGRIVAMYRADRDDEAGWVAFAELLVSEHPQLAQLFKPGAAAGVITSTGGTGSIFGLAYDHFGIEPTTTPGSIIPPDDEEHQVFLPLLRR